MMNVKQENENINHKHLFLQILFSQVIHSQFAMIYLQNFWHVNAKNTEK